MTAPPDPIAAADRGRYRQLLADRRFRRFFLGSAVSSVGAATTDLGIVLLSIQLAAPDPAGLIALATSAYLLPALVTGLVGGRLYDAADDSRLLVVDSLNRGACLTGVAGLAIAGALTAPVFVALLVVAAVTRPAGGAGEKGLMRVLVQPRQYLTANSLVQGGDQLANMLGPALAGLVAAFSSPAYVFAVDGLSFFVFAAAVGTLRLKPTTAPGAGSRSVVLDPPPRGPRQASRLRVLFGLTFLFFFLYGPFIVGFPLQMQALAAEEGHSSSFLLGLAWSVFGVGSVLGGLLFGLHQATARPVLLAAIVGAWGAGSLAAGLAGSAPVVIILMFTLGLTYAPYLPVASTLLQVEAAGPRFGTLMGHWSAATGAAAASGLAAAAFVLSTDQVSPEGLLALAGCLCLVTALAYVPPLLRWTLEEAAGRRTAD